MCTVTYIPIRPSSANSGYLLTSNRDEKTARAPAFLPEILHINHKKVAIPFDPVGKGSWVAAEESGRTVCLLNGAFEPHLPQLAYKHSRGLVVTKYFNYRCLHDFAALFDFSNLEPFTLVVAEESRLHELRWDGTKLHQCLLDENKPYIWSSVTLYSPNVRSKREWMFKEWLSKNLEHLPSDPNLVFDFHQFSEENAANEGIAINRDNVMKTVSITAVSVLNHSVALQYRDLINHQKETIRFGPQAFKTAF